MSSQQDATKSDSTSTGDELSLRKHKTVAIDTSQNASFTHRLLPAQSPEFDNVINQVIQYISVYFCLSLYISLYIFAYLSILQYILFISVYSSNFVFFFRQGLTEWSLVDHNQLKLK